MVRFGNVLGSTGSVIPKFKEQIARGGPVTVTHPDIIRYFMSIPEAAQLVLQAGLMGKGGEIFVLDMGEPVKIEDLARQMIRLSGFSEDEVKIVFTGLRRGEKLYEELLADNEHTLATGHPKVRVMRALAAPDATWVEETIAWLETAQSLDDASVRDKLARLVPEYRPPEPR
jgi:FlaA1/EpsC-like NDP-sugar epimerase